MKPASIALVASLLANVALVALYVGRTSNSTTANARPPSVRLPATSAGPRDEALRAALAAGDVAALIAAGVPADVARELTLGRAVARYMQRTGALENASPDGKWWRNRRAGSREEMLAAQRELSDAMIAAFGRDPFAANDDRLAFLPAAKRESLRRINQDYDELMAKYGATGGVQLASDREKLKLLRAERDRDIAALLSSDELAEYDLRTSPTSAALRSRYGDAIQDEDEFRKIYDLQKGFDEKYPREALTGRVTSDQIQARAAAERQLQEDIRAAVGDDAYAALRRASDNDLRNVDSLVSRLNLPADTTTQVAAMRDSYSAQSQRISADTSVNLQDRRAQLQDLAAQAKADLGKTLGAEAADAYVQRSPWLSMLNAGIGFSTNPKDAPPGAAMMGTQSVFPVMPAGATASGAPRQVMSFVSTDGGSGGGGGSAPMIFSAGPASPRDATQVYSVVSTTSTTATPASAAMPTTAGATTNRTTSGTPPAPPKQ